MATLKERLAALTTLLNEDSEEAPAESGGDLEAENQQLKDRIAELEEEQAEANALMERVLERLEGGDETPEADEPAAESADESVSDSEEDDGIAALQARIAELEAAAENEAPQQRQAPQRRQTRQRRAAGPSRNAAPNIESMTLEERAEYFDKVVNPADQAGRQI